MHGSERSMPGQRLENAWKNNSIKIDLRAQITLGTSLSKELESSPESFFCTHRMGDGAA
jgi:hypothetical protein